METWNLEKRVVEGTYLGVAFRGVVIESRPSEHSRNPGIVHTVALERPVRIGRIERKLLIVSTSSDVAFINRIVE